MASRGSSGVEDAEGPEGRGGGHFGEYFETVSGLLSLEPEGQYTVAAVERWPEIDQSSSLHVCMMGP